LNKKDSKDLNNDSKAVFWTAFFFIIILILPCYGLSEEIVTIDKLKQENDRLNSIKIEIADLTRQVKDFETKESSILEDVEKYQLMLSLRTAELRGIEQNLKTTELEIVRINSEIKHIENGIQQSMTYLKGRLRTMYKLGEYNYFKILLSLKTPDQMKKGIWYLSRLTKEDKRQITSMEKESRKLNLKLQESKTKKKEILELKDLSEKKHDQISLLLSDKEKLLGDIRSTRTLRLAALGELNAASHQLEELIHNIAEGALDTTTDINLNIKNFKGLLTPPVEATIRKKFGEEVHPVFEIKIPHNGITYSVKSGTEVQTIFSGKVIYNKRFKGYGNLVIIDHGSGIVSFYAHLLKPLVKLGDHVSRGQKIGLSGESGSLEGEILFFEILEDGKPADPMVWLKNKEK
jgi:septal ring factor EnvC (AmiA/AmiB activator)